MSKVLAILLVAFASEAALAGEGVTFTAKPAAARDGEKTKIGFAVSAPADVEVAVLGADGKIVRHLAAGVLGGKNPPAEPLKAGLVQSLQWDGKDDDGKPAAGGPFKVRVRAGMSVKFGRIIGTSPYTGNTPGNSDGLAVAPDGTLYVKLASYVGILHSGLPWQLRRLDKAGKYQNTILPPPPSTDPAKASGFSLIDAGDGLVTPRHGSGLDVVITYFGDNIYSRVIDNQIVFIDNASAKLTFFKLDGSNAIRTIPMRTAPDKLKWAGWLAPQTAFSPDGKYAYYSNVANFDYPDKPDPKFPQGWVYRQDLTQPGSNPERFYGLELPDPQKTKYWQPSAWDKKTAAAGIAVDAKGNLFVCDLVNQEVVEVSLDGKKLGSVKVPWPDKVLVSSKTGTLYVASRPVSRDWPPPVTLLKVTGRGSDAKVIAQLALKGTIGQTLALDESGAVPALWLAGSAHRERQEPQLIRVEDRGTELVIAQENILNPDKDAIDFVSYGAVDAEADLVYIAQNGGPVWRYSGETGEGGLTPIRAADVAIGPGGMIYAWGTGGYDGPVVRYTRDFKPAPLAATGKHTYGQLNGRFGRGNSVAGFAVDRQGRVYATCGFNDCHVRAYDADGKMVEYERKSGASAKPPVPALISYVLDQGGSLRLDPAGNIYVLEVGLPRGHAPPRGFEKDPAYLQCSGSIYKFTPKGGEFKKTKDGWDAEGAVAVYSVPSGPISGNWNSSMSACHCTRPRFDVDAYGRLYIPNGITYKVTLLDNADNHILTFGGYGNWDAQGPQSAEPKPEIPLGCPILAGASDKYIYVGDMLNHRVVRADKVFAAEESCELK
jgi:hypothetical protein